MSTNDGGPAFPQPFYDEKGHCIDGFGGMALRDYFAAKAMQPILDGVTGVTPENQDRTFSTLAEISYAMADAMLAARSKT